MAAAKDVSGIYSPETLQYWKTVLGPWVNDIVHQKIEPNLNSKGQRVLSKITVEMPPASPSNDPFDYEYSASGHTLTIPALNVKFLYDLVVADVWLEQNGFDDTELQYLSVLKYQDAAKFPGGRYLSPFEALAVPHDKAMRFTEGTQSFDRDFQQLFNGALLFLLAHEVGHVLADEKTENMLVNETRADIFAFQILARAKLNPAGAVWLFNYLVTWEKNAGDFQTPQQYQAWLKTTARHPAIGDRMRIVGLQLTTHPQDIFPDASDADPRIALLKQGGADLLKLAGAVDNLTGLNALRQNALQTSIESLAVHARSKSPVLQIEEQSCVPEVFADDKNLGGTGSIFDAARVGDLKRLEELVSQDPILAGSKDNMGYTPLIWAAERGQKDVVDFLLSKGRSVNETTSEGYTPLHAAIAACRKPMMEFLLSKGANVNARSRDGRTPLLVAVSADFPDAINMLLAKQVDINAKTDTGTTPLQLAAAEGHTELVKLLLAKGADVNLADTTGFTPLFEAIKNGNNEIVELLLAKGADVNSSKDAGGFTALHLAAFNGRKKIAQLLIAKGARLDAKDENGETPCQLARQRSEEETATLLCREK